MRERAPERKGESARVRQFDLLGPQTSFLEDALHGLSLPQKRISPKYFYDATGSRLFEAICALPEYYLTRAENALMQAHIDAIAARLPVAAQLIEFGSGASTKTHLLIGAMRPSRYVPIDISADALRDACGRLQALFPALCIRAILADFTRPLRLDDVMVRPDAPRVVYFPGSTIGNFTRAEAGDFLHRVAGMAGPGGQLLIGVDLRKDRGTLEAAYNDPQGITARFNLNVLARMNRELGADFRLDCFRHRAFYDESLGRIEMHLESRADQSVHIAGRTFDFRTGETIHTEISCKYDVEEFEALGRAAGFVAEAVWLDPERYFSVHLMRLPDE